MRKSLKLKAKTKINIKYYTRLIGGYFIFFAIIFSIGLLFGKLLETMFVVSGYFMTRFVMPKIKHFNTTAKCIFTTSLTFLFAIAILCIPKSISIIWAIGIGAVIPLIMYAECLLFDKKKYNYVELENFYENAIKPKPFNVDTCTEAELLERCSELRLSQENTELAVEFFIKKTKQSILADRYCVDEKSITRRKIRLKEKLNSKN